jgi:ATP-binding cassette subfamily F protein uup
VLEETLGDYAGTVILISHDRDFLDRVVSAVIVPEGDGVWNEYAGGYSDMLTQRGRDISLKRPQEDKKPAAKAAAPAPATSTKRRLSFNEKFALENLPKQMAALEEKITILQAKLEDPKLFERDRKAFDQTSAALAAAHAELHAAEEKWLELELLRADVEGA